jgi:5-methylcytosine-specific restriction protein A
VRGQSRCEKHTAKQAQRDVQSRGTSAGRGYDAAWQRLRDQHYQANPFCSHCLSEGRHVAAQAVDHIVPHRGDDALRLDSANLQSLCLSHHRRKTATEGEGYRAPRLPTP